MPAVRMQLGDVATLENHATDSSVAESFKNTEGRNETGSASTS